MYKFLKNVLTENKHVSTQFFVSLSDIKTRKKMKIITLQKHRFLLVEHVHTLKVITIDISS